MLGNITKKEKTLGIIVVCVALTALVYNFLVEPLIQRWNDLAEEIRSKEMLLAKHNRILREKAETERLHSEYTMYFQKEGLTHEEESAIALGNIEKLARGARVRMTNIKPLTTKSYDNYSKFTFRITAESRMDELAKFIYDLQSSEQLLKIERMVLRAKERQADTIKAILHITKISVF